MDYQAFARDGYQAFARNGIPGILRVFIWIQASENIYLAAKRKGGWLKTGNH